MGVTSYCAKLYELLEFFSVRAPRQARRDPCTSSARRSGGVLLVVEASASFDPTTQTLAGQWRHWTGKVLDHAWLDLFQTCKMYITEMKGSTEYNWRGRGEGRWLHGSSCGDLVCRSNTKTLWVWLRSGASCYVQPGLVKDTG